MRSNHGHVAAVALLSVVSFFAVAQEATALSSGQAGRTALASPWTVVRQRPTKHRPVFTAADRLDQQRSLRLVHRSAPRVPSGPASVRQGAPAIPQTHLSPAAQVSFGLVRTVATDGSLVDEPSIATDGTSMLETWNWGAATSSDAGSSWSQFDPYTMFPRSNGGFCCDQIALYEPSRDVFIWILQYLTDAAGNNRIRVAVAHGAAELAAGTFRTFSINAQQMGEPDGVWLDQPKVGTSNNFFYLEATGYDRDDNNVGSKVLRVPLDAFISSAPLSYTFWNTLFSPAFVQGATTTAYFASHVDESHVRVYILGEGSNTLMSSDVTHSAYPSNMPFSCRRIGGPASSNWCAGVHNLANPTGFSNDDRILTGWLAGGTLGFAWNASQGSGGLGSFRYPYVHVVRINPSTWTLIDEPVIWSPARAFQYASFAPNVSGDIGGVVEFGGGTFFEGCAALVMEQTSSGIVWRQRAVAGSAFDPDRPAGGDYLTTRTIPGSNDWLAGCYALPASRSFASVYALRFAAQASNANEFSVSVTKAGTGSGVVSSMPAVMNCGDICYANFTIGTRVTLIARPDRGSVFSGWSGDCVGSRMCTVSTFSNVTAAFSRQRPDLKVAKIGRGSGLLITTPSGISCGTVCHAHFDFDSVVILWERASPGSVFIGWGGSCTGRLRYCRLTMTAAKSVRARFDKLRRR